MCLRFLLAVMLLGRATMAAAQGGELQFEGHTFSGDLPLAECKAPVHWVFLKCRLGDGGAATLTLDPSVPKFNEFGDEAAGGNPSPVVTLTGTLKLVKKDKELQRFEIRGPKIVSRLSLAFGGLDRSWGNSRLLVHDKGGEVRYVIDLTQRTHRINPCHTGSAIIADDHLVRSKPPTAKPESGRIEPQATAPQASAAPSKALDGLWTGAWGGGQRDGVVFQPVIAELFIKDGHFECAGFRNPSNLTGTVRLDASARRMRITPAAAAGSQPSAKTIDFTYDIKGDQLTLTDADGTPIQLTKLRMLSLSEKGDSPSSSKGQSALSDRLMDNPLANAQVELVTATGIDNKGDLLVIEYTVLRAGQVGATYLKPERRSRSTKEATILQFQEAARKKVAIDEARRLIGASTPVVVTYRQDDGPAPLSFHKLWKDAGPPTPDSEPVRQMFARVLRPGTLLFVLSARENRLQP